MQGTLALGPNWDLGVDSAGNIAVLTGPAAILQDVASSIRLFQGELWYDTSQGVPYFAQILNLGRLPPPELVKAQLVAAAKTVPGVASAVVTFTSFQSRLLTGYITVTMTGVAQPGTVTFGARQGTAEVPWYVNAAGGVMTASSGSESGGAFGNFTFGSSSFGG
jgi:hypothetical protein